MLNEWTFIKSSLVYQTYNQTILAACMNSLLWQNIALIKEPVSCGKDIQCERIITEIVILYKISSTYYQREICPSYLCMDGYPGPDDQPHVNEQIYVYI